MINFNQMAFIKKLYFNRMAGSDEEKRAAEIIRETVEALGGSSEYESFDFPSFVIDEAKLELPGKNKAFYYVTGFGFTGSTPEDGTELPFIYGGTGSDIELSDCEGKAVFVNAMHHDLYRRLIEKKAAAFLTFDGTIFDDVNKTDLAVRSIKQKTRAFGELPGVTLRAADALKLIKDMPKTVKITLKQHNVTLTSGNVISDIKGENDDEITVFTAHYDSARYSRGAWDNASGCANLMALYSYYIKNKPLRSLRFIWCGGEEAGLLGSKAYVSAHANELEKLALGVNIDMTGTVIGNDVACVSGDGSIKSYLEFCAKETAFHISVSTGIFPSDSSPFANAGVPFITLQRGGQGGMHSRNDVSTALSEQALRHTTEFIRFATERLVNAKRFPAPRQIPQDIREELENYFG